jgi:hypothetical protein
MCISAVLYGDVAFQVGLQQRLMDQLIRTLQVALIYICPPGLPGVFSCDFWWLSLPSTWGCSSCW